jgi:hypothetical protein
MIEWLSTACCLYGARLKNENTHCHQLQPSSPRKWFLVGLTSDITEQLAAPIWWFVVSELPSLEEKVFKKAEERGKKAVDNGAGAVLRGASV